MKRESEQKKKKKKREKTYQRHICDVVLHWSSGRSYYLVSRKAAFIFLFNLGFGSNRSRELRCELDPGGALGGHGSWFEGLILVDFVDRDRKSCQLSGTSKRIVCLIPIGPIQKWER